MSSKLSIHLSSYPSRAFDIIGRMQPGVVKVFNQSSEGNIDEIRRRSPNTLVIYRQYTNLDYHGSADAFFAEISDTLNKLRGRGILWEGINEPAVNSTDDARALNAWYVRFAQLMHAQGELVAGFSWSTGNPTPNTLSQFIPYLTAAAAAADVHAFHEYYSTWGAQKDWVSYRAFEAALPAAARKPVVITEAGLDENGDPFTGGWRGRKSPQEYLDILKAYDGLLLQDPYVLGATVYQWGDGAWPSFELDSMIDLFSNYIASVGGGVITPKPWPIPQFGPSPVTSATFNANPSAITAGASATLTWSTQGASAVTLNGQAAPTNGSKVVSPTQTTNYALHVVFVDGSATDLTATLTVNPPPTPTYSFSVTPAAILLGQSATLKWDVENVREVYLDGEGVTGHDTRIVTPAQTKTYTLHVVFVDNSTKDLTATITVTAPPVTSATFNVNPSAITAGASATLTWSTQGASAVTLNGQAVAANGSQVVTPAQTTTYALHIVLVDGSNKDLAATATVTAPPVTSATFNVNPSAITAGASATLTWSTQGASAVTLNNQATPANGSQVVSPTQTTTYALHVVFVDNSTRDLTATVTVTAPLVKSATFNVNPSAITSGASATLTWSTQAASAVTLNNQTVAVNGSQVVSPTQTTTYALHVVFVDNSTRDLTATVTVTAPPVKSATFNVNPSAITAGASATLTWSTQGASVVTLNNQAVATNGSQVVTLTQTTTYALHVVFVDNSTKDLTTTITVTAPPVKSATFNVNPSAITVGASATLTWSTQGATTVMLNNQAVAANGSQVVTLTQTTTYALHVVFIDGSTKDLTATATVTMPPPATTRPPTVVITPDNIARLKTYPRPAQDNGRGLHFNLDLRDETNTRTVAHLQSINCKWTMIYAQDENQAGRAATACWNAGIMPIVRIGKKVDEPFDPVAYVNALKAAGAPPYVQIYNEPGDRREWKNWPGDSQWTGIFAARWAQMAIAVFDAGGYPGLQVLSKEESDAAVDSVKAQNRTDIWQRAFFALHNYGANHPPAYPYDPRNQQDHAGSTILDDDTAVLNLLEFAKWMQDRIGLVLPIIGGEGGWEYGAAEDNRYPKTEQPYHAQYHAEMFDWFRKGVLSNGEALPDYLFSLTPWIEGGWGADDWWGGPLGDKTDTINAVKSLPPFVRQFSWNFGATPQPTYSFSAAPTSIAAGATATLKWDAPGADGVSTVTLDGQPVAAHGTKTVTPAQTTTYGLRIVFPDGTTKDLSATVTVTATPPTPDLVWDPRLDGLGVKLKRADAAKAWRLTSAQYQDPAQMANNHHVYVKALRADGSPAAGVTFFIDWVGRASSDQPAFITTDANGEANTPLWASMDPNQKNGIYFISTRGDPGDTVSGLGLPNGRNVDFVLTFRWNEGTTPPPSPTYSFTATPTTVAPGASATLNWSVQGASAVSLGGATVNAQGSQAVSPAQTTTYGLRIVFLDGSTKDLSATVTVTSIPPPSGLQWDPRLDPLGVQLTRSTSSPAWRLIVAKYQDETESGGNHHIYYKLLNANGTPAANVKIVVDWNGRAPTDQPAIVVTDNNGETNCALWSILHPELKDGPYFTFVKDQPSDKVSGMGLPVNRHVNFLLTFQYG